MYCSKSQMLSYLALSMPKVFQVDFLLVEPGHVDEQCFRRAGDSGLLVREFAPPIDDRDVEFLLDLPKPRRQRGAIQMIQAAVQNFALRAEPVFRQVIARPERAHQNISLDLVEIGSAGEQPLQHRSDSTDLLNGFMRDVNDGLHNSILSSAESGELPATSLSAKRRRHLERCTPGVNQT
jgi:hypothetical protein